MSTSVGGSLASDPPVIEFPIGEWAVGDDELDAPEVSDADGIGERESEPSDDQLFCPVCGIHLTGILVLVSVKWTSSFYSSDIRYSPPARKQRLMSTSVSIRRPCKMTPSLWKNIHQLQCQSIPD